MSAPVTPETLSDEMILAFREACSNSTMRTVCIDALSTDAARRYPHESSQQFSRRKATHGHARQIICDAINARRAKEQP